MEDGYVLAALDAHLDGITQILKVLDLPFSVIDQLHQKERNSDPLFILPDENKEENAGHDDDDDIFSCPKAALQACAAANYLTLDSDLWKNFLFATARAGNATPDLVSLQQRDIDTEDESERAAARQAAEKEQEENERRMQKAPGLCGCMRSGAPRGGSSSSSNSGNRKSRDAREGAGAAAELLSPAAKQVAEQTGGFGASGSGSTTVSSSKLVESAPGGEKQVLAEGEGGGAGGVEVPADHVHPGGVELQSAETTAGLAEKSDAFATVGTSNRSGGCGAASGLAPRWNVRMYTPGLMTSQYDTATLEKQSPNRQSPGNSRDSPTHTGGVVSKLGNSAGGYISDPETEEEAPSYLRCSCYRAKGLLLGIEAELTAITLKCRRFLRTKPPVLRLWVERNAKQTLWAATLRLLLEHLLVLFRDDGAGNGILPDHFSAAANRNDAPSTTAGGRADTSDGPGTKLADIQVDFGDEKDYFERKLERDSARPLSLAALVVLELYRVGKTADDGDSLFGLRRSQEFVLRFFEEVVFRSAATSIASGSLRPNSNSKQRKRVLHCAVLQQWQSQQPFMRRFADRCGAVTSSIERACGRHVGGSTEETGVMEIEMVRFAEMLQGSLMQRRSVVFADVGGGAVARKPVPSAVDQVTAWLEEVQRQESNPRRPVKDRERGQEKKSAGLFANFFGGLF
ncbi:unnamed protein product [Amoebophrya sp. A120]|nr:unnamed protein product [Amoebophrya sp. A120]|eukprot:GSA120T00012086001.1